METPDETAITEISIRPDGRIYVFGMSQEVLEALAVLCPQSPAVQDRLNRLASLGTASRALGRAGDMGDEVVLNVRESAGPPSVLKEN